MTTFADKDGKAWTLELDAFVLGEVREVTKIEEIDEWLFKLERDEVLLLNTLHAMCIDPPEKREFAKLLIGAALDQALEAVRGAAQAFFPPNRWSEIQSRLKERHEAEESYAALRPMLAMLNQPDMPDAMRMAVMEAISEQIEEAARTASATSENGQSASGPDATPSKPALPSRVSAGSSPAA